MQVIAEEDLHDPRTDVQGRQGELFSADGMAVLLSPFEVLIERVCATPLNKC
jgi:hypothetical protein